VRWTHTGRGAPRSMPSLSLSSSSGPPGAQFTTQFTAFTGTKAQKLTQKRCVVRGCMVFTCVPEHFQVLSLLALLVQKYFTGTKVLCPPPPGLYGLQLRVRYVCRS
jgi:hypothetical protein